MTSMLDFLILVAFITGNSSLEPLIEGLFLMHSLGKHHQQSKPLTSANLHALFYLDTTRTAKQI